MDRLTGDADGTSRTGRDRDFYEFHGSRMGFYRLGLHADADFGGERPGWQRMAALDGHRGQ